MAKWALTEGKGEVQSPQIAALPRQEGSQGSASSEQLTAVASGIFMNGERKLWSNKS